MRLTRAPGGNGNPVADGDLTGPGLDAWFTLGVRLESLTAELEEQNRRWRYLWDTTHRVQITGPPIPSGMFPSGEIVTATAPDLLGPRRGWYWDICRLTFASSLNNGAGPPVPIMVWKNAPTGTNLVDLWASGDDNLVTHVYGKGQLVLGPEEYLVYGTAGPLDDALDGVWAITGEAVQVAEPCWPMYLR